MLPIKAKTYRGLTIQEDDGSNLIEEWFFAKNIPGMVHSRGEYTQIVFDKEVEADEKAIELGLEFWNDGEWESLAPVWSYFST